MLHVWTSWEDIREGWQEGNPELVSEQSSASARGFRWPQTTAQEQEEAGSLSGGAFMQVVTLACLLQLQFHLS